MRVILRAKLSGLLAILTLIAAGCAPESPTFLNPSSSIATEQTNFYLFLLAISVGLFTLICSILLFVIIRYRQRPGHEAIPDQRYRHLLIEGIYTGIPLLVAAIIFVLSAHVVFQIARPASADNSLRVTVVGHQWFFEYRYPDLNIVTANELHIPASVNVLIELQAADVIHSFWVPQLSGKIDLIPGVHNRMWLNSDEIGEFYGQCAELCGVNHANMRIRVFVHSQEDFDTWVANQQQSPPQPITALERQGYDIITQGLCTECHDLGNISGPSAPIAPNLNHLFSRTTFAGGIIELNTDNLRRWLENTQAIKPGNLMHVDLTEAEIDALLAYLTTLH